MDLAQRLSTCKQCEKREFNPNSGVVCSLTLRKPEFESSCGDFLIDPKVEAKIRAKTYASEVESNSGSSFSTWGIIAIVVFVIRMVIRFARD